ERYAGTSLSGSEADRLLAGLSGIGTEIKALNERDNQCRRPPEDDPAVHGFEGSELTPLAAKNDVAVSDGGERDGRKIKCLLKTRQGGLHIVESRPHGHTENNWDDQEYDPDHCYNHGLASDDHGPVLLDPSKCPHPDRHERCLDSDGGRD